MTAAELKVALQHIHEFKQQERFAVHLAPESFDNQPLKNLNNDKSMFDEPCVSWELRDAVNKLCQYKHRGCDRWKVNVSYRFDGSSDEVETEITVTPDNDSTSIKFTEFEVIAIAKQLGISS